MLDENTLAQYRQAFLNDAGNSAGANLQAQKQAIANAPRPGLLSRIIHLPVNVAKATVGGIEQNFQDIGHGLGTVLGGGKALSQYNQLGNETQQTVVNAANAYKAGQLSKSQYTHILANANETYNQINQNTQEINKNANAKKTLAGAAQLGSYLVAPELAGLKAAAPVVTKVAENAALGGVIGGGNAIENDGNARQVIENTLIGGATGGAIGGASGVLRNVLNRRAGIAPGAETAAPVEAAAPTAPQVITHEGPTTLTAPAPQPAAKALDTLDATDNYISAPTPDTTPSAAPVNPVTSSLSLQKYATPADLAKSPEGQFLKTQGLSDDQISQLHAVAQKTPIGSVSTPEASAGRVSASAQSEFEKAYTAGDMKAATTAANSIADPTAKQTALDAIQQHAASAPAAAPKPSARLAKSMGLPEGYKADTSGSVYSPSGKELTVGEAQELTQAKYLTDYEKASRTGDTATMQKIAAAHPGDSRLEAPIAAAPKKPNFFQRVGQGLESPAAGTRNLGGALPYGATKEAEIFKFMKDEKLIHPGGNAESAYRKLPTVFKKYQQQMHQVLVRDNTMINAKDLSAKVKASIDKENRFTGSDTASDSVKTNTINSILKSANKDGNLTVGDIYDMKQEIQAKLDNAYAKIDRGKGVLTGNEDALLAARNAINDALPGEAHAIGQKESMLFDTARALDKARHQVLRPGTLPGLVLPAKGPSQGLAHAAQSAGTLVGAPIERFGNLLSHSRQAITGAAEPAARATVNNPAFNTYAGAAGAQGAVNLPSQPEQQPEAAAQPGIEAPGQQASLSTDLQPQSTEGIAAAQQGVQGDTGGFEGLTTQDLDQVMLQDLLTTGGANLSKLSTLRSLIESEQKQNQPQALSQTAVTQLDAIQRAQTGLDSIEDAFKTTRGTGEGVLSKVLASPAGNFLGGHNVQNVNNTIQISLPDIAKALGLGTTSAELHALAKQLPNTSDTQKSAQAKLNVIRGQIQQYASQFLNNQSNYVQPSNNTLDTLAQLASTGQLSGATQ